MAWYEVFVLWVLWCWERIRPFDRTRRDGRNEDDLTSLTDRMPVFEEKIIVSTVHEVASSSLTFGRIPLSDLSMERSRHMLSRPSISIPRTSALPETPIGTMLQILNGVTSALIVFRIRVQLSKKMR